MHGRSSNQYGSLEPPSTSCDPSSLIYIANQPNIVVPEERRMKINGKGVNPRPPRAGLNDRLSVIMSTACLASSLCARFVAPRPCTMLESTHNAGRNLSCCSNTKYSQ